MRPPLIAEQFGMLAALTPGRINLGLGRTPGTAAAGLAVPVLGARFYEKHGCVEFARTEGIPMVGSADVHFRNILTRRLAPGCTHCTTVTADATQLRAPWCAGGAALLT